MTGDSNRAEVLRYLFWDDLWDSPTERVWT
jgi:hypothetical protein